jgi:hypothetical protein
MDDTDIDRFLAAQPSALRRSRVIAGRPDLLPLMERWGDAWRALCTEVEIACPDELVILGNAMIDAFVYLQVDRHHYAMLTPADAREARALLLEGSQTHSPEFAGRASMLPVFGEDGDYLLLAKDGRIHVAIHDDPADDRVVAGSLAELVVLARPGRANPG